MTKQRSLNQGAKIIALVSLIIFAGCDSEEFTGKNVEGRFDVLEKFNMHDGKESGTKGRLIKNRKTGECYIMTFGSHASGIAPAKCNTDQTGY